MVLLSILVTVLCTVLCICLHLFMLRMLWVVGEPRLRHASGPKIAVLVLACMMGHAVEIAVFGFGIFILAADYGDLGLAIEGTHAWGLDLWYYSACFYTSLGGSTPRDTGLRLMVACEAVAGLVLVTWTASFLFLLMQRFWVPHERKHD